MHLRWLSTPGQPDVLLPVALVFLLSLTKSVPRLTWSIICLLQRGSWVVGVETRVLQWPMFPVEYPIVFQYRSIRSCPVRSWGPFISWLSRKLRSWAEHIYYDFTDLGDYVRILEMNLTTVQADQISNTTHLAYYNSTFLKSYMVHFSYPYDD